MTTQHALEGRRRQQDNGQKGSNSVKKTLHTSRRCWQDWPTPPLTPPSPTSPRTGTAPGLTSSGVAPTTSAASSGLGYSFDYLIRMPSGRVWWRNRHFLRPSSPQLDSSPETDSMPLDLESSSQSSLAVRLALRPKCPLKNQQVLGVKEEGRCRIYHVFYVMYFYVFVAPFVRQ